MASTKREKELARQRAERQAARRAAAGQRRKQRQAVIASVVAVLLVAGGAVFAATQLGGGDAPVEPIAAPTSEPSTEPTADVGTPAATSVPTSEPSTAPTQEPTQEPEPSPTRSLAPGDPGCEYPDSDQESPREIKKPPTVGVETTKQYVITMTTDRGVITWEQDSAKTPCTSNNLRSLAHFKYFDDTPCHRLTTAGISVLQCGDPTGTGRGGPGYTFADEALEGATYPRGTVAMANGGPDTNGSQFFLVYEDSSLPPNYTPFGRITSGLDVLDRVAAEGSDESNGTGDGKPNLPVQVKTVRATEKA